MTPLIEKFFADESRRDGWIKICRSVDVRGSKTRFSCGGADYGGSTSWFMWSRPDVQI